MDSLGIPLGKSFKVQYRTVSLSKRVQVELKALKVPFE